MESKICVDCGVLKKLSAYYKRMKQCKDCWNAERRNAYKQSICRYCAKEFRPGVEGRYKYCTDKCRFMAKVKIDQVSGCWLWQGHRNRSNYGTFVPCAEHKRSGLAHRMSYKLFKDDFDNLLFVCHKCDNPPCVNPDHLFLGTPADNSEDARSKGRNMLQASHKRLTIEDVKRIRLLVNNGVTRAELARLYNVGYATVIKILKGYTYKDV
jgi:HNH endonuclease